MARTRGGRRLTRPAFGLTLQCSAHYVGGYHVFGRELEHEDSTPDRSFEDSVMLLGGVTY